jgi:hypothetical protein
MYFLSAGKREILAIVSRYGSDGLMHPGPPSIHGSLSGCKTIDFETFTIHYPLNLRRRCNFHGNLVDKSGSLCIVYQNVWNYKRSPRAIR